MKPIYTFLIPLGLCFILSGLLAETTYSLSIGRSNINQQKTITPAAPTGDPIQAICQGSRALSDPNFTEIDINAESGASISWYTSLSSTSTIPINSILPVGDNTYYISQTVNGIESADRLQVRVLIPDLYLTGNSEICPGTSTSITFNYNSLGVQGNVQSFSWTTGETSETINVTPPTSNFPTTYEVNYVYDSGLGINNLYCKVSKDIYSRDLDAPVADASSLADVTAQCSVTSLTAPTATDNCAGSVTVTNNASLPITTQGTTVVTWTFEDANGNTTTQTQNVIIDDVTGPTFTTSPASVTVQCDTDTSATTLGSATATDNCGGTVAITSTDTAVSDIGNNSVITRVWTATDVNGNASTYMQTITVVDTTAPVANVATLADVFAECSIDALDAPTATDNCAGLKRGTTTTSFPITTQGTTVVTWTYTDENGNTTTQDQNVVIDDTTAPVADASSLANVTAQCSVTSLTAPTATDNCAGSVTVTNNASLPITTQGTTVVTWTYTDAEGNTSTQDQNIIIEYVDDVDALDEDYFICNDSNGGGLEYLLIDPGLIGPDYEFVWLDEFGNILSQQPTYEITQEGVYSLEIYYSSCPATIEFFTVTEIEAPTATVDIITGDFSTNNIIEVNATSLGTYEYSLDGGGWQDNNTFINVAGGTHTINIKDVRGCGITSYTINLIDYPRFFTPNGDGFNDNWNIKNLSSQRDATIYIFDRYGKLIKQIWPSGNGWDGTYNGQQMPTNDYWFLINYKDTITDEPKQFRAHFTLKR